MMKFVGVQNECRVLWYVHPVVHKVFHRKVWRRNPKWRVDAQHLVRKIICEKRETKLSTFAYLLDDRLDVRKALLILCTRPTVSANNIVEFCMSASLDFWI
jgi:hypothetical protein